MPVGDEVMGESVDTQPRLDDLDFTFAGNFFPETEMGEYTRNVHPQIKVKVIGGEREWARKVKMSGHRVIDEMLSNPVPEKEKILERQQIIRQLIGSGRTAELLDLSTTALLLGDGLKKLLKHRYIDGRRSWLSNNRLYDLYLEGDENAIETDKYGADPEEIDVTQEAEASFSLIEKGLEALSHLAEGLANIDQFSVKDTAKRLQGLAQSTSILLSRERLVPDASARVTEQYSEMTRGSNYNAKRFVHLSRREFKPRSGRILGQAQDYGVDNSRYLYEESHSGAEFGWAATLSERLEDINSVLEIARRIERQGWSEITLDEDKPEGYQGGWNLMRAKEGQVQNDSVGDQSIKVLSAANSSGKTFHMESDLYAHLVAQSTGYAPVESGNFHIYDSFTFLGRVSSSGSQGGRGAFIGELARWRDVIDELGEKPYIYIDEGASSTSPAEQARFLIGLGMYIKSKGGRVMLSTHNELVADLLGSLDDGEVYHFDNDVDHSTGQLICHHKMLPGSDDSKFIALARARGFDKDFLSEMESFIENGLDLPEREKVPEFPVVESYSEQERQSLMQRPGGIGYMFPEITENPLFVLLSEDRQLHSTTLPELINNVVLRSQPLKPQEVLERQRSLRLLTNSGAYIDLLENVQPFSAAETLIGTILAGERHGMYHALNPLFNKLFETRSWSDDQQPFEIEPDKAVAYLMICKHILSEDFAWSEELAQLCEVVDKQEHLHQEYQDTQPVLKSAMSILQEKERLQRAERQSRVEHLEGQEQLKALMSMILSPPQDRDKSEKLTQLEQAYRQQRDVVNQIEDTIKTVKDSFSELRQRAAAVLAKVDEQFKTKKWPQFSFKDLSAEELGEYLAVLELPDRKLGQPLPEQSDFEANKEHRSIFGFASPANFLAYAIRQVTLNDKRLEQIQQSQTNLGSVHLTQSAHHIAAEYAKARRLLDPDYQTLEIADKESGVDDIDFDNLTRSTPSFTSELSSLSSRTEDEFRKMFEMFNKGKPTPLTKEVERLMSLLVVAKRVKEADYAPVVFNQTGEVVLKNSKAIVRGEQQDTPNDLDMHSDGESIRVLSGPHGSGKTYYEKRVIQAILMGQTLGYAPASSATMPFFDRVVYIDRVAQDSDADLSAGMQELEYWKEASSLLDTPGAIFAAVDEAGSSTSPKYQAAFNSAIASEFARTGNLLMLATHNHSAAQAITQSSPRASGYHFDVEEVGENEYGYKIRTHNIVPGLRESDAIDAAKEAKLQQSLIDNIKALAI